MNVLDDEIFFVETFGNFDDAVGFGSVDSLLDLSKRPSSLVFIQVNLPTI